MTKPNTRPKNDIFHPNYAAAASLSDLESMNPRSTATYVALVADFDASGSMTTQLSGVRTRYQVAVSLFSQSLRRMQQDSVLADSVHLFVYVFGNDQVRCICDGAALSAQDIDLLEKELLSVPCQGNTPMGKAINQALDRMEQVKTRMKSIGQDYKQPILTIISDSEANDDMSSAMKRVEQLQTERKLVFLPFGIGEEGQRFKLFEKMLASQGQEFKVATNEREFKRQFKLLDATVLLGELPTSSSKLFGQSKGGMQ